MTQQDAFNKVWDWFVVQKHPPSRYDGPCAYRGKNGNRCAIGLLIPDADYNPSCELNTIEELYGGPLIPDLGLPLDFLTSLQEAHDLAYPGDQFTGIITVALEQVAEKYNLTIPTP